MTIIETLMQAYGFATAELKCPACKHAVKRHYKPGGLRNGQCQEVNCHCDHKTADDDPQFHPSLINSWKEKLKALRAIK